METTTHLPGMPVATRVTVGPKDSSVRSMRELVPPSKRLAQQYRYRVLADGESVVEAYFGFIMPGLPMVWLVRVTNDNGELIETPPWRKPRN